MAVAPTFSDDGSAAISRKLASPTPTQTCRDLRRYYEIVRCVEFLASHPDYQKVALQFPDQLLCDSVAVVTTLARETGRECVILGDTSYGSCCVDEVAASHASADCIIHYGPSCLTQTERLPVVYVFGREEVRMAECVEAFRQLFPDPEARVLVLYDTVYSHCMAELQEQLSDYPHCTVSHLSLPHPVTPPPPTSTPSQPTNTSPTTCSSRRGPPVAAADLETSQTSFQNQTSHSGSHGDTTADSAAKELQAGAHCYGRFGRCFRLDRPVRDYAVFYVGHEGQTLTNLMLSYSQSQFYSYQPVSGEFRRESVSVNKALGRRYFLVQKAKEARTVGILVGTLGAADSLKVIGRLKTILKQSGKKYYTIAVGKLNAAKMANFMEIDIYVLVACPENSLVESQEFYKPVVTPFEMEVACLRGREWSGEIVTDYRELFSLPAQEEEHSEEEPEFSLISGSLLPSRQQMTGGEVREGEVREGEVREGEGVVAVRSKMDVALPNSAAEFLSGRGWKGLERRLGEGGVVSAAEGKRGVASAYSHENFLL